MEKVSIKFKLNGKEYAREVASDLLLVDLIREDLKLTGTKISCGKGECGACTVIMDGKPVNTCIILAAQADGADITTIEGIAEEGKLHPIQQAFIDEGAVQCGYCIPGMVMSAKALLDKNPHPSTGEIQEGISGNLCRCTGYIKIIKAIEKASKDIK